MTGVLNVLNIVFFEIALISVALGMFQYAMRIKNKRDLRRKGIDASVLKQSFAESSDYDSRKYYTFLAIVALIGVLIRVWQFGSVPGGFNQDGAMAAVDAKALADYATDRFGTHLPVHLYAWGYGQMSSLLSYLMAIFIKPFGLSPITARLPQLLVSIAGGVFFYLFIRDLFGKTAGLVAAVFVAINPWHFLQSRWALDCNLLPHFFMGGLYFLNKGINGKSRFTFISMVFFSLCMYCYGITIYTIPVFLLATSIFYMARKKLTLRDTLISAGIYLVFAWPFLLTMAVNYFEWDTITLPFATIQYFSESVRSNDILVFSAEPLAQFKSNVWHLWSRAVLQMKDLNWNDVEGFGTMFLFSMPFFVIGFVELFRNKTQGNKGLVLIALLTGIWAGLLTNNVNINRVNIIFYGMMMFVVLGIYFTIQEIKYLKWSNLCIYAVAGIFLLGTYFGPYADSIKTSFHYGFGESLAVAEESGAQQIYITVDNVGNKSYKFSEILMLFYDKTDAAYFQGKINEDHGETLLPYSERYKYTSITPEVVLETQDLDVAYVITNDAREYFDESRFNFDSFGNYCAVTKR